jgi:hypothetical protein
MTTTNEDDAEQGGNFPERAFPVHETAVDSFGIERIVSTREDGWTPAPVTPEDLLADQAEAAGEDVGGEQVGVDPTKAELQDNLRDQGLPVSGNKDELQARLEEAAAGTGEVPA